MVTVTRLRLFAVADAVCALGAMKLPALKVDVSAVLFGFWQITSKLNVAVPLAVAVCHTRFMSALPVRFGGIRSVYHHSGVPELA